MAEGKLSIFYDRDAEPARLKAKTIAIVGYGSQGHAHALNLKDGGYKVAVGLRPGSASRAKAEGAGLSVMDTAEAARSEYGFLPAITRARASILKPGSMILQQPHIPIPIQIRFPFPSWATRAEEAAPLRGGENIFEAFDSN